MLDIKDENAIFQLMNIGANPMNTLTTKSRSQHIASNKSNSVSSSTKMKSWTEKLVKFPRNSAKKKIMPSMMSAQNSQVLINNSPISLPRSISNSSEESLHIHESKHKPKKIYNYENNNGTSEKFSGSSLQRSHPKRTISLPKPTSELHTFPRMKIPGTAPLLREGSNSNLNHSKMFDFEKSSPIAEQKIDSGSNEDLLTPSFIDKILPSSKSVDKNDNNSNFPWSSKNKRSFVNMSCTLCDESISNKSNGERIIELECQHLCHQECLSVSLNNVSNSVSTNFHSVFPDCNKCLVEKNQKRQCLPKSDDLKDRLLSDILIYNSATSPTTIQTIETPVTQVYSPLNTPVTQIHTQSFTVTSPINNIHNQTFLSNIKNSPYNTIHNNLNTINGLANIATTPSQMNISVMEPLARNKPLNESFNINSGLNNLRGNPRELNRKKRSTMLEPLILSDNQSVNDIISIAASMNHNSGVSQLPLLRSYFIEILLSNFKETLIDWKIDDEFGLLRLVDTLLISKDSINYEKCWCFLFQNNLVTVNIDETIEQSENSTFDTKLSGLKIYDIDESFHMDTLDSSTIKCVVKEASSEKQQKFFLTEATNNGENMIIQKWISGFLDSDLTFNEYNITTTIKLPLIIRNLGRDSNASETFTGLINPNKVVELGNFQRTNGSLIIRRALNIGQDAQGKHDSNTLMTMMTSVTSILSLKKEKPEELFTVIQIDFDKIKKESEYNVIFNTLKAITIKFPTAKFCAVNKNGYIITIGSILSNIINVESIKSWSDLLPTSKFDPLFVKSKVFTEAVTSTVGVAVISNGNMDTNKSCLLMDFKPFTCVGRTRPNELKIKVGYLNVDYSDKINELIEINDWSFALETICYSFNFGFEEDSFDIGSMFNDDSNSIISSAYSKLDMSAFETRSTIQEEANSLHTLTTSSLKEKDVQIERNSISSKNKDSFVESSMLDLSANNETIKKDGKLPIEELQKLIIKSNNESPMYNAVLNKTDDVIQDTNVELDMKDSSINIQNDGLDNNKSVYSYL